MNVHGIAITRPQSVRYDSPSISNWFVLTVINAGGKDCKMPLFLFQGLVEELRMSDMDGVLS